jgi:predicted porin
MRRVFIGTASALLLTMLSGSALAEDKAGVEVGLKMFLNQWTVSAPGASDVSSDSTMLLGPAVEIKFNNPFFVSASYLVSTSDYRFNDPNFKSSRQDAEIAIGYFVIPGFGLVAGYKNSSTQNRASGAKSTLDGPLLGILGIAQADPFLSFYGKLDYLFTRFKGSDALGEFREDSPGWIFEFGLRYAFTKAFLGDIGYRYETNKGVDTGFRDSFSGLTLSGMLTF